MTLPSYEELTAPTGDELPSYDELTQGVTATGAGIPGTSSGSIPDSAINPTPEQAAAAHLQIQEAAFGPGSLMGSTIAANRALSPPESVQAAGAVAGAVGQMPRLGPEEPTREDLAMLPPWDVRRIQAAQSFGDLQALETEAQRKPVVTLPKPESEALSGVASLERNVEGVLTPENISMVATLPFAPGIVQKVLGAYFGATMGKEAVEQTVEAGKAIKEGDLTKAGESLVTAGTMGLFATKIGEHTIGETRLEGRAHAAADRMAKEFIDKSMDDLLKTPVEDLLKPTTEEPTNAIRQPSPTEEVLRPESTRPSEGVELPRVGEQDRLQTPAAEETQRGQPAEETPNVTEPVTEAPSPLAGPALKPAEGEPLKGQIGEEHGQMKIDAARRGEDFTEAEHGFVDAEGNFLTRLEGTKRALDTGLITKEQYAEIMARTGPDGKPLADPGMTSQDLKRFTEAKAATATRAYTNGVRERFASIPVSERGDRFIEQNGMIFDRFYSDSVTPPAMDAARRAELLTQLNASRYNQDISQPISIWRNEDGTTGAGSLGLKDAPEVRVSAETPRADTVSIVKKATEMVGKDELKRRADQLIQEQTPEDNYGDRDPEHSVESLAMEDAARLTASGKWETRVGKPTSEAPIPEPTVPGAPPVEAAPVVEAPSAPGAKPVDTWTSATETPKAKPEPPKAQTPAEQIETIAAHQKETKAAERLAHAPDTSPAKLKVQKAYLLDALDKTLKQAPDRTAYRVEADADAAILDNNRHFHSGDTKETFDARREAELTPLFEKYGIPERAEAEEGYLNLEGGRTNPREGMEFTMDTRAILLRAAVDAAVAEQQPKIEIEVPGDGSFRIVNTQDAIKAFRETVRKGFPTAIPKAIGPPKLNLAPPPTAIPPLGKPKTKEELAKIAGVSASEDETRYVLVSVMSDGKHLIATDGRRLMMLDEKAGGTEAKPVFFDPKTGKPKKIEGNYPNWKQVMPGKPKKEISVETAPLLKLLIQAQKMTDEKSKSVKLWQNKDGSIGVSSNTPDVGEFEGNVQPNAKTLAAFDPEYLIDALRGARQLGHDKVTLGLIDEMAPLTVTAPKMKAVVMPMRIMSDPFLLQTGLDVFRKLKAAETVKELRSVRKMTDLDKATGEHSRRMQTSFEEAHAAQKEIRKTVPKESRRNAISVWIEANGDAPTLQGWEAGAKGKVFKKAASEAQTLTPEEIAIANRVKSAFSVLEGRGRTHDVLSSHRDNYVPHIWDIEKRSALSGGGKLVDKFRFNKARTFNTFAEGDAAGFAPKSLDISNVLPAYLSEMNKVIAARQFVEDISAGKGKDSRPLVLPEGRLSKTVSPEGDLTYLVDPTARKNVKDAADEKIDQSDYVRADQPALKEWNWEGKDNEGNPIYMKDNLLLHPEAAERLNAMIGRSKIKQWAERPTTALAAVPKAIVRALDASQQVMKREMFGLISTFHQVQEGWHAIGHSVNPFFNIPKIDLRGNAAQRDAANHGLMLLPDKEAGSHYLEGVGGERTLVSRAIRKGGKPGRILADVLDGYQDFLFQRYIPGLKIKTYDAIVGRNTKRFQKELASGELTDADVKALSATQTNAAYGHLNYAMLDRSPTMQHLLSLSLLAPDFLEARTRFTGQAAKSLAGSKAGNEQFKAIAQLAMIQAGLAYTAAQLSGGKWDEKHPFEVQINGRRYTLRSVPEDLFALVDEPRKFAFGRISPLIARGGLQAATGRNYRGEATSLKDTAEELLAGYIPIAARGVPGVKELTQTGRMADLNPLEQFASTMGLRTSRYSPIAETHKIAHEWMKKEGLPEDKGVFPISKYQPLRYALEDGDDARIKEEYDKLLAQPGETRAKIHKGFKQSMNKPFTQSEAMDHKMKKSLKPEERALFDEAVQKRKVILSRFYKR